MQALKAHQKPPLFHEAASLANPYYPQELAALELEKVRERREYVPAGPEGHPPPPRKSPGGRSNSKGDDYVGLALSGGGIRSATFCLGACQHLAEAGFLRKVDFLSTVSGGGFIGSFIGAWIHRTDIKTVEARLPDSETPYVRFLRENGRYISPNGSGDMGVALASYLRGWMAILLALGFMFFTGALFATYVQETANASLPSNWTHLFSANRPELLWLSPWWLAPYAVVVIWVMPFGAAFWLLGEKPLRLTPFIYAFMGLSAVVMVAYAADPASWKVVAWTDLEGIGGILILAFATFIWSSAYKVKGNTLPVVLGILAIALAALSYLALSGFNPEWPSHGHHFSPATVAKQIRDLYAPTFHPRPFESGLSTVSLTVLGYIWVVAFSAGALTNNVDLIRRKLTEFMALGIWIVVGLSLFALLDTVGGTLFKVLRSGAGFDWSSFKLVAVATPTVSVALVSALKALSKLSVPSSKTSPKAAPSFSWLVVVCAVLLATTCGVFLNLCAHLVAYRCGAFTHLAPALQAQALAAVHTQSQIAAPAEAREELIAFVALLFGLGLVIGRTKTLLNLSSDLQLYTARITRAYLGASNSKRQDNPAKLNVTQPDPEDDVPFTEYHPEIKGGPLHIVNVTVNETISGRSNLEQKDRHGFSMALGPVAVSTGRVAHAVYGDPPSQSRFKFVRELLSGARVNKMDKLLSQRWTRTMLVHPLGRSYFHPLAKAPEKPSVQAVEALTLGGWVGVSGVAFSTGLGQRTSNATSFLAGFFNIRLGYWWDSRIDPLGRKGELSLGFREWAGYAFSEVFYTQGYLLDEILARFHAPSARRLWNLSDGGHFENTATYELIRRRVSFIIMCDCGADPEYAFEDVANLVRKARIDLDAEITFLTRPDLDQVVDPSVLSLFGHPDDFKGANAGTCPYVAALASVDYFNQKNTPQSWLLVLKPTLGKDLPQDIRDYFSKNPTFPQESTLEQFFDEAQWESYRRLGRLIAERVFCQVAPAGGPVAAKAWRPSDLCRP